VKIHPIDGCWPEWPEMTYDQPDIRLRAEAEAVRRLHVRVEAADPAWLLSRRHPDIYGAPKLRVETELSGSLETKSELKHKITFSCTDEEGLMGLFKSIPLVDADGQPITGQERDDILNGRNGTCGP
jgi:hypothetical protein